MIAINIQNQNMPISKADNRENKSVTARLV